ncbi:hypothetical protein B0H13DRAFT_2349520 [Mycena leptocephala]|nr:hypothetical protein B0H13DRAFT_2349520 [Mycena leptocephala]
MATHGGSGTWNCVGFAGTTEYGYGVALLSESKYGVACQGNIPSSLDDALQGEHKFSWAAMPHKGHFLESDVPTAAYLFNSPLYIALTTQPVSNTLTLLVLRSLAPSVFARTLKTGHSSFDIEGAPNVFLETIKRG